MIQTTVKIDGMMCGMCEAHINDAVRAHFSVKSVKSSFKKGETVILAEQAPEEAALRKAIDETGYTVLEITSAPVEKKKFKLFGK